MKEALKNSNTFLGVGKPPACAELHTRPGKPEGLTLSRLGGPEAPHRQEIKQELELHRRWDGTRATRETSAGGLGLQRFSPSQPQGKRRELCPTQSVKNPCGKPRSSTEGFEDPPRPGHRAGAGKDELTAAREVATGPGGGQLASPGLSWPDLRAQPISLDREGSLLCF